MEKFGSDTYDPKDENGPIMHDLYEEITWKT